MREDYSNAAKRKLKYPGTTKPKGGMKFNPKAILDNKQVKHSSLKRRPR